MEAAMHNWTVPIVLFVLFDLLVMVLVLKKVVKVRVQLTTYVNKMGNAPTTLEQLRALGDFARGEHDKIGEYMRASWSGFAEQLPSVITSLLEVLERDAKDKGLTLDRDVLKSMLASSLRAHKIGKGRELAEALKQVA